MALFRPRVGKQQIDSRQAARSYLILQYFHGVVRDDPEVVDCRFADADQAVANAGFMNLDADEVLFRMSGGSRPSGRIRSR